MGPENYRYIVIPRKADDAPEYNLTFDRAVTILGITMEDFAWAIEGFGRADSGDHIAIPATPEGA